MNKHLFFLLVCSISLFNYSASLAQPGYITTIAGTGISGFSGDGGPATAAMIGPPMCAQIDATGNLYIGDFNNQRIRKVSPAGIITTIAGGGSLIADGVPATSVYLRLDSNATLAVDATGNIFFVDSACIRKINATTGIITTVVGTHSSGFGGDGGPATAASVRNPGGICFDNAGNMYIGDAGNNRIRKVNTAGIISTYAGTGAMGFGGDVGPASAAVFNLPNGVFMDVAGNLFVADQHNNRIRKIDATGMVSTVAGLGSRGFAGDGGPATGALLNYPSSVCTDSYGNLYIADFHNSRIRRVDVAGIITTFAGGGSSLGSGIPATSASFSDTWGVSVDQNDNIYVCDRYDYRVCRVNWLGVPNVIADSFSVVVTNYCSGMDFQIIASAYTPGKHVKTYLGNGHVVDTPVTAYGPRGLAAVYQSYSTGNYTIKHVLYNGTLAIDSVSYSRYLNQCQDFSVNFYFDVNNNCTKDSSEILLSQPITIEVDSSGFAIDTLSATSGLHYRAYGYTGTVYRFRALSVPAGMFLTCPVSGTVYDTMGIGTSNTVKNVGFTCAGAPGFDLSINSLIVAAEHWEGGHIYVQNLSCAPMSGTVTLYYSPKYSGIPTQISPSATSTSGNTIVWNLSSLSSTLPAPVRLFYDVPMGTTAPAIGDTVHAYVNIAPSAGDINTSNNQMIIIDTVKGGLDPNEMWVSPSCVNDGSLPNQLRYTINFENTGNDTAHNIYVLDTLPDGVDVHSMALVMSSNEMYTSRFKDAAGHNILKFDFPGINLLDSSHHGQCDGAVIFTISTIPGLSIGTQVSNRAGIYFDVNAVVMTNGVNTSIGCPVTRVQDPSHNSAVSIYPNPTTGEFIITTGADAYTSYTITNCLGQVLLLQAISCAQTKVDVKQLPSGLYYVMLRGEGGSIVKKVVKE